MFSYRLYAFATQLPTGQITRMYMDPKSREQKIVEAMFACFGDMTTEVVEDFHLVYICKYLLSLDDDLMTEHFTLSFIDLWNSEYPEEAEVDRHDVIWALGTFDSSMAECQQQQRKSSLEAGRCRPKLRLINGGLSARPDRPYVAPEDIVHEYDMDF